MNTLTEVIIIIFQLFTFQFPILYIFCDKVSKNFTKFYLKLIGKYDSIVLSSQTWILIIFLVIIYLKIM